MRIIKWYILRVVGLDIVLAKEGTTKLLTSATLVGDLKVYLSRRMAQVTADKLASSQQFSCKFVPYPIYINSGQCLNSVYVKDCEVKL